MRPGTPAELPCALAPWAGPTQSSRDRRLRQDAVRSNSVASIDAANRDSGRRAAAPRRRQGGSRGFRRGDRVLDDRGSPHRRPAARPSRPLRGWLPGAKRRVRSGDVRVLRLSPRPLISAKRRLRMTRQRKTVASREREGRGHRAQTGRVRGMCPPRALSCTSPLTFPR